MSSIFTREKRNGSYRMILNLKQLKNHIEYEHFKMESLQSVLNIIRPNCRMARADLKDAFYTVPIHPDHQKFLKFKWEERCYLFRVMPSGYSEAMKVFKPPFSILRSHGYLYVIFSDDSHLQGNTFSTCEDNANTTVDVLQFLGFTIHPVKSVLVPTLEIEFLGFVLNSVEMKIKLTDCKSSKIISKLLYKGKQTIRDLASVIGSLVATFPVLPYGKLHYRELERCKISPLKFQKGKYNGPFMSLSTSAITNLHWWLKHLKNANQSLQDIPVDCTIQAHTSDQGWVLQIGILQLVAGGALWRETIFMFWN